MEPYYFEITLNFSEIYQWSTVYVQTSSGFL